MKEGKVMGRMTKKEMIQVMKDKRWNPSVDEKNKYSDVKAEYEAFIDETSDDSSYYPNGRDFDAENIDD